MNDEPKITRILMFDLKKNETLIKKSTGWRTINWSELIHHRDLLFFLTVREIRAKYAQSVLGVSWAIIQPLFTALMFTVIFGKLAKINSNGIPYILFSFLAMLPWTYFSGSVNDASISLVNNTTLITKVYFPRIFIPISSAIARMLDLFIGFLVLILLLIIYSRMPNWHLLVLPFLLLILFITSISLCILFSAMAVQYRDVKHAMNFFLLLLMYSTPVVYSTYSVPQEWQKWYALNPIVGVIEGFRAVFLNLPLPWLWIMMAFFVSIIMLIFSSAYFRHKESIFADVV